jgi:hypothetical protein
MPLQIDIRPNRRPATCQIKDGDAVLVAFNSQNARNNFEISEAVRMQCPEREREILDFLTAQKFLR